MTTPDPTRAEQIESEWREWHRAKYNVTPISDPSQYATYAAYHAAATRRDSLEQAEREYLEACYAYDMRHDKERGTDEEVLANDYLHGTRTVAFRKLRARRAKVDRVAEAHLVLSRYANDLAQGEANSRHMRDALDLLTAELRERDGGKP